MTTRDRWLEALELCKRATSEVQWRDATSRLYYAVYHAVCERLCIPPDASNGNHGKAAAALSAHSPRIGNQFRLLQKARVFADYQEFDSNNKSFAAITMQQATNYARGVLAQMQINLDSEPAVAQPAPPVAHSGTARVLKMPGG